jgi:hypothetical protein
MNIDYIFNMNIKYNTKSGSRNTNKKKYNLKRVSPGCYSAYNPRTKRFFARCTTKKKAIRQTQYLDKWLKRTYSTQLM